MNAVADYIRDPAEIYRKSFETVRREADLSRFSAHERDLAVRLIHACGMTEIAKDLVISDGAIEAGRAALASGRPILCDVRMVEHGIIRRYLPDDTPVLCAVDSAAAQSYATDHGTTRSAGGIETLEDQVEGAIVAIGNAPTALFHLLEMLDRGLGRPALIIGIPVGFVGAVESKQELARDPRGCPFVTLHGRRGGSALASAAVNAIAGGLA